MSTLGLQLNVMRRDKRILVEGCNFSYDPEIELEDVESIWLINTGDGECAAFGSSHFNIAMRGAQRSRKNNNRRKSNKKPKKPQSGPIVDGSLKKRLAEAFEEDSSGADFPELDSLLKDIHESASSDLESQADSEKGAGKNDALKQKILGELQDFMLDNGLIPNADAESEGESGGENYSSARRKAQSANFEKAHEEGNARRRKGKFRRKKMSRKKRPKISVSGKDGPKSRNKRRSKKELNEDEISFFDALDENDFCQVTHKISDGPEGFASYFKHYRRRFQKSDGTLEMWTNSTELVETDGEEVDVANGEVIRKTVKKLRVIERKIPYKGKHRRVREICERSAFKGG